MSIDIEEIIHTLKYRIKTTDSGADYLTYKDVLSAIEQQQEEIKELKKSEWISINDGISTKINNAKELIVTDGEVVASSHYYCKGRFLLNQDELEFKNVTHYIIVDDITLPKQPEKL